MHEARLYTSHGTYVQCGLCAHACTIREGQSGICRVRVNRGGVLYSSVYGELVAENVDPIEKKPLFHVLPGSLSYSVSTRGCNFHCLHCQNASISQVEKIHTSVGRQSVSRTPEEVVSAAIANGCKTISYTYVEPTVFFEFAYDCCTLAVKKNIGNVFVSNGYMSAQATQMLAPLLTGINIDIKSFREDFYKKVCGAKLQPVLDTVKRMRDLGVWVEVTTLIIPGMNDSSQELQNIATWLVNVDKNIPWHVTAFYPTYKMLTPPPTPIATLKRARDIGLDAGLLYVYEGNVPGRGGENSSCPACGAGLVLRHGFSVMDNRLAHGLCPECSLPIAGVWS